MKINDAQPGDKFQITGIDEETNQPVTTEFEIIEISWFPSPIKRGVLYHGAKVKMENGVEEVIDFITLECSKKS
jgi:hypothetical protein